MKLYFHEAFLGQYHTVCDNTSAYLLGRLNWPSDYDGSMHRSAIDVWQRIYAEEESADLIICDVALKQNYSLRLSVLIEPERYIYTH